MSDGGECYGENFSRDGDLVYQTRLEFALSYGVQGMPLWKGDI